jgi:hypothetical protein
LAKVTGTDADTLDRLLRHLATLEVLRRSDAGEYALTDVGAALRDDHPFGLRARLDIDGGVGRAELAFVELLHSVRTGEAAFIAQFGRDFWDDLAADPARSAVFDTEMGTDVTAWAPAIIAAYDWGALGHVVDVAGGNGSLLAALLAAHPELHGTVIDLPNTAAAAGQTFAAAGVADRADDIAGNFFEPLPAGLGAYVLTAIIHDWGDEQARAILRRCAEAAGVGGRVFVIEKIGVDGALAGTEMDLRLLVYMGGRERDLDELAALIESAGCKVDAVHRAGAIVIVEATVRS